MPAIRASSRAARLVAAALATALVLAPASAAFAEPTAPETGIHAKNGNHPGKPNKEHGPGAEGHKAKQNKTLENGDSDEHHDNGLHLGWLANGKLTDEEIRQVAGDIEDVSASDIEKMSVGEIIKAAREDDLSVHDLGELIDEAREESGD